MAGRAELGGNSSLNGAPQRHRSHQFHAPSPGGLTTMTMEAWEEISLLIYW